MGRIESIDFFADQPLVERHGSAGDRRFEHEPTWVLRGLTRLHLELTPAG